MDMVETERTVGAGIGIGVSFGCWEAATVIKRTRGTCSKWSTYKGRGDSPEAALCDLKKAVMGGEEGWSW